MKSSVPAPSRVLCCLWCYLCLKFHSFQGGTAGKCFVSNIDNCFWQCHIGKFCRSANALASITVTVYAISPIATFAGMFTLPEIFSPGFAQTCIVTLPERSSSFCITHSIYFDIKNVSAPFARSSGILMSHRRNDCLFLQHLTTLRAMTSLCHTVSGRSLQLLHQ